MSEQTRRTFLTSAVAAIGVTMTMTPEQLVVQARKYAAAPKAKKNGGVHTPTTELSEYVEDVASGRVFPVELPWPKLHSLTNALMPGALLVVCGDPGVGKTYLLLDCLRFWTERDIDASVYFLEEDRRFYLRRILAQQEGNADFTRIEFWQKNPQLVREACERHRSSLDSLGGRITVAGNLKQMELRRLTEWIHEELKSGRPK